MTNREVSSFVLRNKESLAILKPYKEVIVLNKICFVQEIRGTSDLQLPAVSQSKTKEMATKLIDQLTEKFDSSSFKDEYAEKLLGIIKSKAKGKNNPPALRRVLVKE